MPYTKCPNCNKVQQVVRPLLTKDIGCMSPRCGRSFVADEYYLHSNPWSRTVFFFVIGFALFVLFRWVGLNSSTIIHHLG